MAQQASDRARFYGSVYLAECTLLTLLQAQIPEHVWFIWGGIVKISKAIV